MMRRLFDVAAAGAGLILFAPVFALVAVAIKVDSRGPIFFKQERVGRKFRVFWIYKFRTMTVHPSQAGRAITVGEDPRITRVGRFLRQSKIDELPQLCNILKGDMALVGPRPEVPRYVALFQRDYEEILKVRPGLTDLASLKYRDEASLLSGCEDPEREYTSRLLPDKIRLAKAYIERSSFLYDVKLIVRTLLRLMTPRSIA
ncbi:MAG TPA: sugar transferase [Terriglobales bacterium]|nr:sugar transferase [Terriglobales bacterium]